MKKIDHYLSQFKNPSRYTLKKYNDDQFTAIRAAYCQMAKNTLESWEDKNPDFTDKIVYYCMQSDKFKGDLSKGLLLMGSTGTGKTVTLKTISLLLGYMNTFRFKIYTGREMEKISLSQSNEGMTKHYLEEGLKAKMFGMDDIGEEHSTVKVYGTDINVGVEALTDRYLKFVDKGYLTFATTNLNAPMFAAKYGARIESRIHEMFNMIGVTGKDLRK